MIRIAILDDEKTQCQLVEQSLVGGDNNWADTVVCDLFASGTELLATLKMRTHDYDCAILDRQLPDMSGDVILQYLRQYSKKYVPVVMLTNRSREHDVVQGLQAGADEYLTKPFMPNELLFRVQRLIRRNTVADKMTKVNLNVLQGGFSVGPFVFDDFRMTVTFNSQMVVLTEREFRLAMVIFKNVGVNVSRKILEQAGWNNGEIPNKRALDVHIHKLREKLELNSENGWQLRPIYGFGYRLSSSVPEMAM